MPKEETMSLLLRFGKQGHWYIAPKPKFIKKPRIRYGEYPQHLDPESKDWIDRFYVYPELQKNAAKLANKAVRKGFIAKRSCQLCGSDKGLTAHHETYLLNPLLVIWLCHECHMDLHKWKRYLRDHSSMTLPVVGIECLPNLTLEWPVSVIPEFIEHIPSEFPTYAL
jgi:hypothetical protein